MFHDPEWPRAHEWLAQGARDPVLAVLGVPYAHSITPGRTDLAPEAVRTALQRYSPYDVVTKRDLAGLTVADRGNLALVGTLEETFGDAVRGIRGALGDSQAIVLLGGDNSVTRPGVHALGVPLAGVGLLTFDAHFDLRSTTRGLHNGNPVRALLADGLQGANVCQIGIQSFANSASYGRVADAHGITVVTADRVHEAGIGTVVSDALAQLRARCDVIYVDLDMDVLDRAYAPACPGSRPGGFAPWQVRAAVYECGRSPSVRAMDIVEMDPTNDAHDATALAAAACLLAFASGLSMRSAG